MRRPALDRDYFGFIGWRQHDAGLWESLREEARARRAARKPRRCIIGSDIDADAVRMSIENADQGGIGEWLHVEKRALSDVTRPNSDTGLIITNPAVRRAHRRRRRIAGTVYGTWAGPS